MTGRIIMTVLIGTIAAGTGACGDDDSRSPEEQQIISISRNAVYAWIDDGAAGLYDYLSGSATVLCSLDALDQSLSDYGTPADWHRTKDIAFQGDIEATATIVLDTDNGEKDSEWRFVRNAESWRVSEIAGVIPCVVPAA